MEPINRRYGTTSYEGVIPSRSKTLCETMAHLVDRVTAVVFPCLIRRPSTYEGYIELTEAECIGYDQFESLVIENSTPAFPPPPLPRPPPAPPQFTIKQKDWFTFSKGLRPLPVRWKTTSRLLIDISDRDYKITLKNQQADCGKLFDDSCNETELQFEAIKWLSLPMELLKREGAIERYEFVSYLFQKYETGIRGFTFGVRLHSEGKPLAECTAQIVLFKVAAIRPQIEVNLFDKIYFYSDISRRALSRITSALHDLQFGRLR